jgi:hypothetical protein
VSDACPSLALLACHRTGLAVSSTQECVLPPCSPYEAPYVGRRSSRRRSQSSTVPSFHHRYALSLSVTLPRFSTDESVSATAPWFRGPGDMETWTLLCVDGQRLRQWKSRLPRFESASKFEVQAFLVSVVCLVQDGN